jgi:sphingomyelin phosphodiesterase acid-like 3
MRSILTTPLLVSLALTLFVGCNNGGSSAAPQTNVRSGTGLFVSDFHFNPLDDNTLAPRLVAAPPAQWDTIFSSSTKTAYTRYGGDTNFPLLQSALAAMRQRAPNPDIVIISGDFLVHYFQLLFDQSPVTDTSPAAYAAFVNKTEAYLAMKLSQTFPNAQIVPALGNVDSACGAAVESNQQTFVYAGSSFLNAFSSAWNPAVNRFGGAPNFQATFATGGYYSTAFPIDPQGQLIVLDTQPWSGFFDDACGPGGGNIGNTELTWLAGQLKQARSRQQRVWLLGHIPPGIETPGTTGVTSGAPVTPFYSDFYSTQLYTLFAQYRDILAFGIFAHEHTDDFRVARDASGKLIFGMKLVPSITPLHYNNPAFVQFTYDPAAGAVTNATTWYLTNLATATAATPGVWASEYDFDSTYGQTAMDSNGVANAVTAIMTQSSARAAFTRYYTSSNPGAEFSTFLTYGCALGNLTLTDYNACSSGR